MTSDHGVDKSASRVREMFGEIAGRYDFLNHFLSAGIDRSWRRKTVALVRPVQAGPVLDVCTGTADLALAWWRATAEPVRVVGADFSRPMLAIGREKTKRAGAAGRVTLVEADGMALPFADDTFEVVSVAFGLRNISDTRRGLSEMVRVCRSGGSVAVLEFSMPRGHLGRLYRWYFRHVLPRIGQAVARNRFSAYNYLPASVSEFLQGEAMLAELTRAGLRQTVAHRFTFGVATLYLGVK